MEDDGNTVMVQKTVESWVQRYTFYKWGQNEKRVGIGHVLASVRTQFWRWRGKGGKGKACARGGTGEYHT